MARHQSSIVDGLNFSNLSTEENKPLKNTDDLINLTQSDNIVDSVKPVESVHLSNSSNLVNTVAPVQQVIPQAKRKIGIELTEENYQYLKGIAWHHQMQMKEYLNQLLELDKKANSDLLRFMPSMKPFL